jgi:two-component system, NtrC family, nitrogen regulation sensor histidine kinase NtrY
MSPGKVSYGNIINFLNRKEFEQLGVEVYAPNGRLIGWNKNAPITKENLFPLNFSLSEAYFSTNSLITWLTIVDTIELDSDHFYFTLYLPFQKHYSIQNPYFRQVSFKEEVSAKVLTSVEISYSAGNTESKDGRNYNFNLLNLKGSRIAEITFAKPTLESAVNSIKETSSRIQGILFAAGYLLLFFGFRNDFKQIQSRLYRFLILAVYLAGLRILLYLLSIPAAFMNGILDDPSLFSSAFAWGIVRSPVEFLVTNILLIIIALKIYLYLRDYSEENRIRGYWYLLLILPSAFLFLMTARGLNAGVKSIVFDSSIRYFRNQEIIPGLPEMLMNLNLLLLGTSVVLILVAIVLILLSFREGDFKRYFWITFFIFQAAGFSFVVFQKQPLITPLLQFILISLVFTSVWLVKSRVRYLYNFIYFTVTASIITISLLNFYNQDLERESLKTTALELNRPNDNLLNFLLRETLRTAVSRQDAAEYITKKDHNHTAAAFSIWSNSPLQRESLSSSVAILGNKKNVLGEFKIGIPDETLPAEYFENYQGDGTQIIEIEKNNYKKIFKGIAAITSGSSILGYVTASVVFDLRNPTGADYPDFLISQKNYLNSVIDASEIRVFEILNSRLSNVYGDIYPSRDQIKPILDADYSDGENWQYLSLNNEPYIAYSLRNNFDGNEKITVVLYKAKQITWNMYNFFKIFVVHAIFILILFLIIFLLRIGRFKYTFRMQLLTAFLFISIIPVIVLAAYNRMAVAERTHTAVSAELNERLQYIENHIRIQLEKHPKRDFQSAFENAASEVGISFNVYENTSQSFSSKEQFYESGLFNSKLHPEAHFRLNYLSFREYLAEQEIENYGYNAFYKKLNIGGKDLILGVNDAFNRVRLSYTSSDADILLFGVYSFAVIIIIIINTILANRISSPIRKLTRATGAVAQGDLSIQLENRQRGEIRELIDGFNAMTRELQKNEAELAQMERETAWKEIAKQVAHEIKNPLTPMKLAVQQMIISFRENKNFESIFTRVTGTLLSQIENLNQIASEFSRFARMPHFNLEKINIVPVIKDTLNLFVDEKVTLEFNTETEEAFAEADVSQLRRLFINMIRNSIQSGADQIIINLEHLEDCYEIKIKDNGNGINPEYQDKIFNADFTTKEKGMGLGLKLAKRFIEGIKGSITLLESSSEGTVFRITIPEIK